MFLAALVSLVKSAFAEQSYQSELDSYLKDKNPQNNVDLEFWMTEFDSRRRLIGRYIANGDVAQAQHIRNFY